LLLHISPGTQSTSLQHWKQPVPEQHFPPEAQSALEAHLLLVQVSVVQELPSLHCAASQHCSQLVPQSLGVEGAHAQTPPLQSAPLLQASPQTPQCRASVSVLTSQSVGSASQSSNPVTHTGWPPSHI
jgi:hypothetical protein